MHLNGSRYALLRTYRRDGTAVDTPIWFALDGGILTFRTKVGPKTKRIGCNPAVELWPCDHRGRLDNGATSVLGRASILCGEEAEAANCRLHRRYGWQYNVIPLIPVPGVTNVHSSLPWREKLRRARMRTLWPDSVIVRVDLIG